MIWILNSLFLGVSTEYRETATFIFYFLWSSQLSSVFPRLGLNRKFVVNLIFHTRSLTCSWSKQQMEQTRRKNKHIMWVVDCSLFTTEHVSSRLESCEHPKQPLNLQTAPSHLRAPTRGRGKPLAKKLTQNCNICSLFDASSVSYIDSILPWSDNSLDTRRNPPMVNLIIPSFVSKE